MDVRVIVWNGGEDFCYDRSTAQAERRKAGKQISLQQGKNMLV